MSTEDKVTAPFNTPEYLAQQGKRDVFAAIESTDTMRAASTTHLPKYPGEEADEYNARLNSATIDGIVTGGVDTLCGAVFFEEIDTSAVSASIVPLLEDIDNQGTHFNVFARDAFKASFDGFSVIAVDMPLTDDHAQQIKEIYGAESTKILNSRPYWRPYKASDVGQPRFRTNPITKQKELELIVFREISDEPAGVFVSNSVTRYRVWLLEGFQAKWQVWIEKTNGTTTEYILESEGIFQGRSQLCVSFIGDVCDDPKLLTESRLEIKAYQKESSFDVIEYLSIPTFYTVGYDGKEPLQLGASAHVKLPATTGNEKVGYAQIDANGHAELKATIKAIKDEIKGRVNLMVASATVQGADKTATQVVTEDKDKQARLVVWADELHDALERALQFTAQLMGLGDDKGGTIELRTKWDVSKEKAEEIAGQADPANDKTGDEAPVN